jgi:hypothetical protein
MCSGCKSSLTIEFTERVTRRVVFSDKRRRSLVRVAQIRFFSLLAAALESLRLKGRDNGNSTEYLIYDRLTESDAPRVGLT